MPRPKFLEFPRLCILEDTGERRYPEAGEIYFWRDSNTRSTNVGQIIGPFTTEENDDDDNWAGQPEDFAIYRVLGEES